MAHKLIIILLFPVLLLASNFGRVINIGPDKTPALVTSDSALYVTTGGDTSFVKIADTVWVKTVDTTIVKVIDTVRVYSNNFYLDVAAGRVPGKSHINKFGHNEAAESGDDIWGGGGKYEFFPDSAKSMDIHSTSALDDSGNVGAWIVTVVGLDSNWVQISENVVLNGISNVNLLNKYVRMYRAFALAVGTADTNSGVITVEIQGSDTVGAYIEAGHGQTQQSIYTIPAGKTGYFIKGYVGLTNSTFQGEDGIFKWLMRLNNGYRGAWLVQGEVGLINIGSSYWQYEYGVPAGPLSEKTDIRIQISEASATMHTVAGYDILLEDN